MRALILLFLVFFLQGALASTTSVMYDSGHSKLMNFKLKDSKLIVYTDSNSIIDQQIRTQLGFMVGMMNAYQAGPYLSELSITVKSVVKNTPQAGQTLVTYDAVVPVSWPKARTLGSSMNLILPHRAGPQFLSDFRDVMTNGTFGQCTDEPDDATAENMFYHYRPEHPNCLLKTDKKKASDYTFTVKAEISASALQTQGKAPEYKKIWSDKELTAFVVFGKDKPEHKNADDVGVQAMTAFLSQHYTNFGKPASSTVDLSKVTAANVPSFVEVKTVLSGGKILTLRVLLVGKMMYASESEVSTIQKYSPVSDVVMYNGHAGLGLNMARFLKEVRFTKGKYQVFFINGCDTFSYHPKSVKKKLEELNPGTKASLWMDLISNSMPAYFTYLDDGATHLLKSLAEQTKTYSQILTLVDSSQKAAVIGEEDNQPISR